MNCIDDHNYYDNGGYPPSTQDETRRNSRVYRMRGFSAKRELIDESAARIESDEQRPMKFPVKNELDVILRKVRSVLNKISAINYSKLQKRWINLIPMEPDQLREILQLLVEKAMNDPMYMQIYARLASDVLEANPSVSSLLRRTLCNRIHHELKNAATDMELARFGHSEERADVARRRRVMLYRLIAELFVEDICSTKFVTERIADLMGQENKTQQEVEESLESLCVLLMFAGSKLEEVKGDWLDDVFAKLNLTDTTRLPIVSKRMQFMLLDLMEMKSNGWVSQNKWWVPRVQADDTPAPTTIEVQLDTIKARRASKNRKHTRNNYARERSRERTLRVILNQVVPSNLEKLALEFGQIIQKKRNNMDSSVENIIAHLLNNSDTKFIRLQAVLLIKVCVGHPNLRSKLIMQLFKCVKENPSSVPLVRFCAELYTLGMISVGEIVSTLQKNPDTGIECSCAFFHRVQYKLFRDWRNIKRFEKMKIDSLLESMAKNAQKESFRVRCMVMDIHDLRAKNWEPIRPLLWGPVSVKARNVTFTAQNAIGVFSFNEEDGLEFLQENLGTDRVKIEKFVETMCVWAVWRNEPAFLATCGRFVRALLAVQLLNSKGLQPIFGSLVQTVVLMKNKPDAWSQLGILMHEIHLS